MKIAVASDAHGAKGQMDALLAALEPVDVFCFLGDMDKDAEYLDWGLREAQPQAVFYAVAGNNDPFSQRARAREAVFGDVRTLLTHGHLYRGIRQTREHMAGQAARMDMALVLYGHTHIACDETEDGVRMINPGALMHGKWALIEIQDGRVAVDMRQLPQA